MNFQGDYILLQIKISKIKFNKQTEPKISLFNNIIVVCNF